MKKINLATKITIIRIVMIPLFLLFVFLTRAWAGMCIFASVIFSLACATDFLDGYIARKNNQVTDLGKLLDPIADKLLVLAGLLALHNIFYPASPSITIFTMIIISREFIINVFRQLAASRGLVLAASNLGKLKTIITDISIAIGLFAGVAWFGTEAAFNTALVFGWISWTGMLVASIVTIVSAVDYMVKNKSVFESIGLNVKKKDKEKQEEAIDVEAVEIDNNKESKEIANDESQEIEAKEVENNEEIATDEMMIDGKEDEKEE